jgi:hypothetical protein
MKVGDLFRTSHNLNSATSKLDGSDFGASIAISSKKIEHSAYRRINFSEKLKVLYAHPLGLPVGGACEITTSVSFGPEKTTSLYSYRILRYSSQYWISTNVSLKDSRLCLSYMSQSKPFNSKPFTHVAPTRKTYLKERTLFHADMSIPDEYKLGVPVLSLRFEIRGSHCVIIEDDIMVRSRTLGVLFARVFASMEEILQEYKRSSNSRNIATESMFTIFARISTSG